VVELEKRIRQKHPSVVALFIKPQAAGVFRKRRDERIGGSDSPEHSVASLPL
jgi:hypothetical protein